MVGMSKILQPKVPILYFFNHLRQIFVEHTHLIESPYIMQKMNANVTANSIHST